MKDIAYYNGKIGRIDEVQAPITDRGFYFGSSGPLLQQPEAAPH